MIDQLQGLAVGEAHRQIELFDFSIPGANFSELNAVLDEIRERTFRMLQNTLNAISVAQAGENDPISREVPNLGRRFEVNTHNIISQRSRMQVNVQIIISVLRVK